MTFGFPHGHQNINDPNLRFHGVVARAGEGFDPQVLLDPAEEQLDLPAPGLQRGARPVGRTVWSHRTPVAKSMGSIESGYS